jgi:hypothetical protein
MARVPACSDTMSSWNLEGDAAALGEAAREAVVGRAGRDGPAGLSLLSARNLWTDLQLMQISFSGTPSVMERIACRVSPLQRPQGASSSWPA